MGLRYAAQHFEAIQPMRWRLLRMAKLATPRWGGPQNQIENVVSHLDRLAESMLTPEEYANFVKPWIPTDQE